MASDRGAAPPPGGQQGGGKKIMGMPRGAVIAGAVALVAGVAWFLYKRRKSAAAGSSGAPAAQAGVCYDAGGNQVDCSDPSAVSGPVTSALQSEIQDLQGEAAQAQGAAGEQETDLGQLTKEEQELQRELEQFEKQEQNEHQRSHEPCPRGMIRVNGKCVRKRHHPPPHHHHHHRHRPKEPTGNPPGPVGRGVSGPPR